MDSLWNWTFSEVTQQCNPYVGSFLYRASCINSPNRTVLPAHFFTGIHTTLKLESTLMIFLPALQNNEPTHTRVSTLSWIYLWKLAVLLRWGLDQGLSEFPFYEKRSIHYNCKIFSGLSWATNTELWLKLLLMLSDITATCLDEGTLSWAWSSRVVQEDAANANKWGKV